MDPSLDEVFGQVVEMAEQDPDILMHYGIGKLDGAPGPGSGRYPLGSGKNPNQRSGDFLSRVDELRKQRFTYTDKDGKVWTGDNAIAKAMGLTSTQFRTQLGLARDERRSSNVATAKRLRDFDVIEYQYGVMKQNLYEEVAIAIMVGDGREEGTEMKISESHIRSIWNDDDLYTIHYDVDVAAARAELQGSRTDMNFGENFIYAEAIVAAAMYSREKYKGTGTPDLFCTPHLLNVMLLARDLNGRRIYDSKTDLAAALNVNAIYTAEQFEGLVRTDDDGVKHKLLGIFVNLNDYTVGSTKGGEITRFNQFDIDFNQHKLLIETRLSGALNRVYSAIALEEPVKSASGAAA